MIALKNINVQFTILQAVNCILPLIITMIVVVSRSVYRKHQTIGTVCTPLSLSWNSQNTKTYATWLIESSATCEKFSYKCFLLLHLKAKILHLAKFPNTATLKCSLQTKERTHNSDTQPWPITWMKTMDMTSLIGMG